MAQQTAVEFIKDRLESILELYNSEWDKVYQAIEQAKQMEKKQIMGAWIATDNELQRLAAEQYYNETYNK